MEEMKVTIANIIANALEHTVQVDEILGKIEMPKDTSNGDFAYPCFMLAKVLKKSPMMIANEIKDKMVLENTISNVEVVGGYLNFYLENTNVITDILKNIIKEKDQYGSSHEGNGKNVIVDYSSPNIAKPFHLGHFRNTVLGGALYRVYQELGYQVTGVNHLGDWGRQFGLLIEGYARFHEEYDITKDPLSVLSDIYVRISQLAKEDEAIFEIARENFKKLEQGDSEMMKLWEYFREISLKEYKRIYTLLGSKFDSYKGEAFYSDKMDEIVDILTQKGVLVESQGAKIVEVGDTMPPCIILTSKGTTIYATRDLAGILYRARTYDYTKNIYVTASEQILHFKQTFEVAKYVVDDQYQKGLIHVSYGMIRLKTGKMSTREGNVIYINDLIEEAVQKAKDIILQKNADLEQIDLVAKQVGIGALVFHYLKTSKNKDIVFDLDDTLRFDGETGPYVQYTCVRTKSILQKAEYQVQESKIDQVKLDCLVLPQETELVKALDQFGSVIQRAANEYEPSILARYCLDIATLFSKFYHDCSVLNCENPELREARCVLVYATGVVLEKGLQLLGIECPDKM